jgi:hypothetical protein
MSRNGMLNIGLSILVGTGLGTTLTGLTVTSAHAEEQLSTGSRMEAPRWGDASGEKGEVEAPRWGDASGEKGDVQAPRWGDQGGEQGEVEAPRA